MAALAAALIGQAAPVAAQPAEAALGPVVLELFTSQGCSACPPADEMLAQLVDRDDVIALALHVDYWDYIGWPDPFAMPEHSERQKRYARRHGHGTIYTPQVVINGVELLEGFRVVRIMELIEDQRRVPRPIALSLTRRPGDVVEIEAESQGEEGPPLASRAQGPALAPVASSDPDDAPGLHMVQLVRYRPEARVEITAGENAGLSPVHHNIVTEWRTIANWDIRFPLQLSVRAEGDYPVVVIVQEPGQGAILAAARLR